MKNKELQNENKILDQFQVQELEQRFELEGSGHWGAKNP